MFTRGWGLILFVSSESALQIPVEMVHYGTSKVHESPGPAWVPLAHRQLVPHEGYPQVNDARDSSPAVAP